MTDDQAPSEGQPALLTARPKTAASLFDISAAHLVRLERRDPGFPRPYRAGGVVLYDVTALREYFRPAQTARELPCSPQGQLPDALIPESLRRKRPTRHRRHGAASPAEVA